MKALITFLACVFASALFSQSNLQQTLSVNSTGTTADASAQLDVSATDKGMLVPRMTAAQRTAIASPATGLLVFDTTTGSFWFYSGTAWAKIAIGGGPAPTYIADADGNTKVQTEKNANEDIIRFDLGGTEKMVLRKNASGVPRLELNSLNGSTFVGLNAGQANTTGSSNTAYGPYALYSNMSGYWNTANGASALYSNTGGSSNTANGVNALHSNLGGSSNTANGVNALFSSIDGTLNTANGAEALYSNTDGSSNTANGVNALRSNLGGSSNTANGMEALYSNTEGNNNTADGRYALFSNKANSRSTAIGYAAMYWADDRTAGRETFNTAVGTQALNGSTTAADNTGQYNTAIGDQALFSNRIGSANTANGSRTLLNNNAGTANTANGADAMYYNTTGSDNAGFGASTLNNNTTGSFNTGLGRSAFFNTGTVNNTTCIGYDAGKVSSASNRIEIGNTSVSWIGGQVGWATYSDARIKERVQENVPGLDFITRLRPVTYHLNIHRQNELCHRDGREEGDWKEKYDIEQKQMTGFIAQEVEAAAKATSYDFSGVEQAKDEVGMYSVRYAEFVVPLVKAVQEQQAIIENGELRIENLERENAALKSQLDKITAALAGAGIAVEK